MNAYGTLHSKITTTATVSLNGPLDNQLKKTLPSNQHFLHLFLSCLHQVWIVMMNCHVGRMWSLHNHKRRKVQPPMIMRKNFQLLMTSLLAASMKNLVSHLLMMMMNLLTTFLMMMMLMMIIFIHNYHHPTQWQSKTYPLSQQLMMTIFLVMMTMQKHP